MNAFTNAVKNEQILGKTYNGAETLSTTGSKVLNFFTAAGNRSVNLSKEFELAYDEDPKLAFRVALWSRDIRGGAGERQTFRNILKHLEKTRPDSLIALMPSIPVVGRWDDLLIFENEKVKEYAFGLYREALNDKNGLAAKWAPRKGPVAADLRNFLGYTPKQYRKTLVSLTKVVEQQMCAKEWDKIVFDHVPSLASARYQKAFWKNCGDAYKAYKEGLTKVKADGTPERKINVGAVYPYDIIKSVYNGISDVAEAQWKALPNFLGDDKILPIVDCSESMSTFNYYNNRSKNKNPNLSPRDIALSIGIYCADKQQGAFSGCIMSFSDQPKLQMLTSTSLRGKIKEVQSSHWGYSTNIQAAFAEVCELLS